MAKKRIYGATPVQDYSSFKTPKANKWANIRQNRILDKYKTSTGAFANQADDLKKAGYTLNDTMDAVYSPSGGQAAGINKYGSWGGNKGVADIIKRNLPQNASPIVGDRVANTFNVLDQIYGLDEMSKAGENKINKAFDSGRGLQFAPDQNPADPFRVMSNSPTFSEFLGGFGRMLGGGTAKQTVPGLSIANQPRKQEGILGLLFDTMPTLKMIKEAFGSAGNNIQGGIQKLNDYTRPQMIEPRDGFQGQFDQLFNLGKGMLGGKHYNDPQASNSGVMALPSINNNNIIPNNIMLAGLTDKQKMLLDQRRNMYPGMLGIQEMLDNLPKGDPNDPATFEDVETYLT